MEEDRSNDQASGDVSANNDRENNDHKNNDRENNGSGGGNDNAAQAVDDQEQQEPSSSSTGNDTGARSKKKPFKRNSNKYRGNRSPRNENHGARNDDQLPGNRDNDRNNDDDRGDRRNDHRGDQHHHRGDHHHHRGDHHHERGDRRKDPAPRHHDHRGGDHPNSSRDASPSKRNHPHLRGNTRRRDPVVEEFQQRLETQFGLPAVRIFNAMLRNRLELAKFRALSEFLQRCRVLSVVPLIYRLTNKQASNSKFLMRRFILYSKDLMRLELDHSRRRCFQIEKYLTMRPELLEQNSNENVRNEAAELLEGVGSKRYEELKQKYKSEYHSLSDEFNISAEELDRVELQIREAEERRQSIRSDTRSPAPRGEPRPEGGTRRYPYRGRRGRGNFHRNLPRHMEGGHNNEERVEGEDERPQAARRDSQ